MGVEALTTPTTTVLKKNQLPMTTSCKNFKRTRWDRRECSTGESSDNSPSSRKCKCARMYVCMSFYRSWPLEVSLHPHITTGRNTFRLTPCTYTPPPSIQKSRLSITFNSFFFLRPLPSSQPPSCLPILCTPLLSKAFPFVTFV